MWIARALAVLAVAVLFGARSAQAVVLIFEPIAANYDPVDPGYGDRVSATSQDGFVYGPDGGFTPNVEVAYGVLPYATPALYRNGYGDLKDVLFDQSPAFGHLEVQLTADPGWNVRLFGFDMAAWSEVGPINSVQVYTNTGALLFDERDVAISAVDRTVFAFDPPLEANMIAISIDSGNLNHASDYVAVDNIKFGQIETVVPTETVSWSRLKSIGLRIPR